MLKNLIPRECKEYYTRFIGGIVTDLQVIKDNYERKHPLLLKGETGTGKTHALRYFCYEQKLPYYRAPLNGGTTIEDFLGQFVPQGEGFVWVDGMLTRIMREGGVIVFDEINMASPEILAVINAATDDERKIVISNKDGEVVYANAKTWICATLNEDYEGTRPLNPALKDRFTELNFEYSRPIEEKLITDERILAVAEDLRAKYPITLATPTSPRGLMQFEHNMKTFGYETAKKIFSAKYRREEFKAVEEILDLHFGQDDDRGDELWK